MSKAFHRHGLTEVEKGKIRALFAMGIKMYELAKRFDVSQSAIHDVIRGPRVRK